MSDDVLITPASRKIEFFDSGGNIDGKIELDGSGNLNITSAGSIAIGDITQDIHVGDGTQAVDLVFDFASSIYSVANQDLTIGKKSLGGNDIIIDTPSYLNVQTDYGYVRVGPQNGSFSHFATDVAKFYFNKPLVIDGGNTNGDAYLISSYNLEDFVIATNNGTEDRITVKQATGNVGIGVTAPTDQLCVRGGIKIGEFNDADGTGYAASAAPNSANLGTGASDPQLRVSGRASDQPGIIQMAMFDNNNFFGGTTEFVLGRLQYAMNENTQEVTTVAEIRGITSKPNDPGNFDGALTFLTSQGDGSSANLTEKMILTADGNVGIGTMSPETILHISNNKTTTGPSGTAQLLVEPSAISGQDASLEVRGARNQSTTAVPTSIKLTNYDDDLSDTNILGAVAGKVTNHSTNVGSLILQTSADGSALSDRLTITSGGDVGIGDTTPSYKLDVNGDIRAQDDMYTDKLIASEGIRSSNRASFNTMQMYYYDRQSMGTQAVLLRVPVGGSSTANPSMYYMPHAGVVMQVMMGFYAQTLATSGTDTWSIIKTDTNGTASSVDFDINFANLNRIGTNNSYNILIDVSVLADASNLDFVAGDMLQIQRTDSSPINVGNVNAQLWVTFDI